GGRSPEASPVQANDGSFYGTTYNGGTAGQGTVFKLDADGTLTMLHNFSRSDGAGPWASLIQASDGSFYGTTRQGGGPYDDGTVFKMDATGTVTTLHSFSGSDGALPHAGLIRASDGGFYGATEQGGASGSWTVFRVNAAGIFTTLHRFSGSDGAWPRARLIQGSDGSLYGTTSEGGAEDDGVGFRLGD